MKASFKRADLFVFVELRSPVEPGMTPSTGKTMLFSDAVCVNHCLLPSYGMSVQL